MGDSYKYPGINTDLGIDLNLIPYTVMLFLDSQITLKHILKGILPLSTLMMVPTITPLEDGGGVSSV